MTRAEKIRYERLQLVCRKALEQSIKKSISLEHIKSCYPDIANSKEGLKHLENARQQMVDFWFTNSLREFDLIFKDRGMEVKLNELDELIQQSYKRLEKYSDKHNDAENDVDDEILEEGPVYLNKLTPDRIMEANIIHTKENTLRSLSMIHDQLRLDNEELYSQLKSVSDGSEDIKKTILSEVEFFNEGIAKLKDEEEIVLKNLDTLIESADEYIVKGASV